MRVPALHKHRNGQYFVKWAGRNRYLGKDKALAERLYLDQIAQWREWWENKADAREVRQSRQGSSVPISIEDLAERFLEAKRLEHGVDCEARYRKHLKRFREEMESARKAERLRIWDADLVSARLLNDFKLELLQKYKLKPRTINHDLTTIRVMYNWSAAAGLLEPKALNVVKNLPVGPVDDGAVSTRDVRKGFAACPPLLQPWFAINYLALLRPSEVVRVAKAQGRWHASLKGVFILDRGKVDIRVSIKRHVVFSPLAEKWVRYGWQTIQDERNAGRKDLKWNNLDAYSEAIRRHFAPGPKILQKSAASHLAQQRGVAPADVELLLGHVKSRLSVTYYAPHWKKLRTVAAKLKLPKP